MTPPPVLPLRLDQLPKEKRARRQSLQDIFGAYLMWNRSHVLEAAKKRVDSEDARSRLGTIHRKPYDDIASLEDGVRVAALKLAEKCLDDFAVLMLALLAGNGVDLRLESGEAVRFPMDIEVLDVVSRKAILRERIGAGAGFLPDCWGRWLNRNLFRECRSDSKTSDIDVRKST
jgi:hypothetical protein